MQCCWYLLPINPIAVEGDKISCTSPFRKTDLTKYRLDPQIPTSGDCWYFLPIKLKLLKILSQGRGGEVEEKPSIAAAAAFN